MFSSLYNITPALYNTTDPIAQRPAQGNIFSCAASNQLVVEQRPASLLNLPQPILAFIVEAVVNARYYHNTDLDAESFFFEPELKTDLVLKATCKQLNIVVKEGEYQNIQEAFLWYQNNRQIFLDLFNANHTQEGEKNIYPIVLEPGTTKWQEFRIDYRCLKEFFYHLTNPTKYSYFSRIDFFQVLFMQTCELLLEPSIKTCTDKASTLLNILKELLQDVGNSQSYINYTHSLINNKNMVNPTNFLPFLPTFTELAAYSLPICTMFMPKKPGLRGAIAEFFAKQLALSFEKTKNFLLHVIRYEKDVIWHANWDNAPPYNSDDEGAARRYWEPPEEKFYIEVGFFDPTIFIAAACSMQEADIEIISKLLDKGFSLNRQQSESLQDFLVNNIEIAKLLFNKGNDIDLEAIQAQAKKFAQAKKHMKSFSKYRFEQISIAE